ncbi:thiamine phosphate synthase [Halarsenatibacter silvermanii]|uniref:Thiamine-phosphate synthase n=1 Tax=Halarsenatibacter silvermanii TaxID=321763 RepID=A0A1G9H993_9FIRM|nr:thiamine phosphate synthase [Halarsenatibacter silvermanii]SDL09526.1 thiamine-phosphate pyrophosphorylase [Halarsenatibacter silvermanii]
MSSIADRDLYLITESVLAPEYTSVDVVKKSLAGGVRMVQLREKDLNLRSRYQLGQKLRKITREQGAALVINDRVDLAMALEADGVHLGQQDLPYQEARKLLGPDKIIGVSASSPEQVKKLNEEIVDYIGFGSVFSTKSKRLDAERQAVGLKKLKRAVQLTDLPVMAIGGIAPDNVGEVVRAGATGAAVISALNQADDVKKTAEEMIDRINRAGKGDEADVS